MLSKQQRLALFNLCTIHQLTCYEKEKRQAAEVLRELVRMNTLDEKNNQCEFDLTQEDKVRRQAVAEQKRKSRLTPIKPHADT
jgi:hypothetical protein